MASLILGSASPRRRELLSLIADEFTLSYPDVDESQLPGETALAYVSRVARLKAEAVSKKFLEGVILTADTIVAVPEENLILGKASTVEEARDALEKLSDGRHQVITAYCLWSKAVGLELQSVSTEVTFGKLEPEEIQAYLDSNEWRGKAGSYAIQGKAAPFIVSINGSYTNVVGLPVWEVKKSLEKYGVFN